jgi:hypothetical protein
VIDQSSFSGSRVNGIVIRGGSRCFFAGCRIANAAQMGVQISNSPETRFIDTLVENCARGAIAVYNNSRVYFASGRLVGPSQFGLNVFTGGFVAGFGLRIAHTEIGAWFHHGGAGTLDRTAFGSLTEPVRLESGRRIVVTDAERRIENLERVTNGAATCRVCHGPANDLFFSNCAHSLICRRCWDVMDDRPCECELCGAPIDSGIPIINCASDQDADLCGICLTNHVDALAVPCGHVLCAECGRTWFAQNFDCPFCRTSGATLWPFVPYA